MNKEVEKLLKSYTMNSSKKKRVELESLGEEYILKKHLQQHSYINLFLSTFRFIRLKTWISQFVILVLSVILIYTHSQQHTSFQNIMNSYLIILVFSILFFLDELYRSFTSGMSELEQTLKYDLVQHILMKFLIFGISDFFFILFISLWSNSILATSLIHVLIYLLVPFNILSIILFLILTQWKNKPNRLIFGFIIGALASLLFILANTINIYQINIYYWIGSLLLTSYLIMKLTYKQFLKINKEAMFYEINY